MALLVNSQVLIGPPITTVKNYRTPRKKQTTKCNIQKGKWKTKETIVQKHVWDWNKLNAISLIEKLQSDWTTSFFYYVWEKLLK